MATSNSNPREEEQGHQSQGRQPEGGEDSVGIQGSPELEEEGEDELDDEEE